MNLLLPLACLFLAVADGLIAPAGVSRHSKSSNVLLRMTTAPDRKHPCWQDIYDDDCTMSDIYSSNFVAADWIKSMPCAEGVEDCDMPEDLTLPNSHEDSGIDHVDVMSFLNIKRAQAIKEEKDEEGTLKP